jgi:hypothetical protein
MTYGNLREGYHSLPIFGKECYAVTYIESNRELSIRCGNIDFDEITWKVSSVILIDIDVMDRE